VKVTSIVIGSHTTVAIGTSNNVSENVGDAFYRGRATDGQLIRHIGGVGLVLYGEYNSWQLGCGRI